MKRRIIFFYFFAAVVLRAGPPLLAPLPWTLAPTPGVTEMHQGYVDWFVGRSGNGISRMDVPVLATDRFSMDGAIYSVKNMELMSLLKHDPPMIYVTDSRRRSELPAHSAKPVELKLGHVEPPDFKLDPTNYKLRPLREDEAKALNEIKGGKEIAMTDAGLLGAIRMRTSCLKCHEGKEGDLLGAFSYLLKKEDADFPKAVESGTGGVK